MIRFTCISFSCSLDIKSTIMLTELAFPIGRFYHGHCNHTIGIPFDRWWWSCGKGQTWYWTSELNRAAHALSSVITSPQALLEALKCPDYGHIADLQHVMSEIANLASACGWRPQRHTNQYKKSLIIRQWQWTRKDLPNPCHRPTYSLQFVAAAVDFVLGTQ